MRRCSGHPPRTTSRARSGTVSSERPGGGGSPSRSARNDIAPSDSPDSARDIGRISTRANRPAPVWRLASSSGTADPVRMNCPGAPRSSTAARTPFQRRVASTCHSSRSRGVAPARTSRGSTSRAARAPSSFWRYTALAACCRAVDVLPHARGPSMSTAPADRRRSATSRSAILSMYATRQYYSLQAIPATFCSPSGLHFADRAPAADSPWSALRWPG